MRGRGSIAHLALFAVVLLVFASNGPVSAREPLREIVINIPAFTLYLYEDGVVAATYPIGVGSTVKPSLLGETRIVNEVHHPTYYPPDWWSKGLSPIPPGPDNPVGSRWLGLGFAGYGIHGTNDPESIGTAASSGCIRMLNEHVEELADKVGVGTRVTFLYHTIEAWRDPLTGRPFVRVYKDIYQQGTNRIERLISELERIGAADGADRPMLAAILAEGAGEPRPVPRLVPTRIDGEPVTPGAAEYGGEVVLPVSDLARHFGHPVARARENPLGDAAVGGRIVPGSFFIGARAYAPVVPGAEALGLIPAESGGEEVLLERVRLVFERGGLTELPAFPFDRWLLVPIQDLGRAFGIPVEWDAARQAVIVEGKPIFGVQLIGGRAYLPHDRVAELLGVRIRWSPGARRASVGVPHVQISGASYGENGFVRQGELFVPLRYVADFLGFTLGWRQDAQTAFVAGRPIQGMVRDGRVYTSLGALAQVIPQMQYVWDEENLHALLSFDAPGNEEGT